jgi:hypothetical protein
MERNRVLQILQLFAERVGQSGKSPHRHSYGQILALNKADHGLQFQCKE